MCCLDEELDCELDEEFDDEEFDEEEDEYCYDEECKPSKSKKESISALVKLQKHFDIVEVEDLQKYRLLTLKNKVVGRGVIEFEAWLQVKIALGGSSIYTYTSVDSFTENVCKKILRWLDKLLNFEKSKQTVSLFDFEEEVLVAPVRDKYSDVNKYFDELRKYNKKLIEKYGFFDVCDIHRTYGTYAEDYTHLLPKNDKEMIECVKKAIVRASKEEDSCSCFDDYCWNDEYNYIERDGALSDYELIARVKSLIRLYFVPYETSPIMVDDSNTVHFSHTTTSYYYWFDGKKINGPAHWMDKNLPSYELFDYDFIAWLREFFNISRKEMSKDDEVLKELCVTALEKLLWGGSEEYGLKQRTNRFSNFKQFKADFFSFIKEKRIDYKNGGSGGGFVDGYSYSISNFQKNKTAVVRLTQNVLARQLSGQNTNLEVDGYDSYIVTEISDDDVFKIAFEALSNKTQPRQSTLLDFI